MTFVAVGLAIAAAVAGGLYWLLRPGDGSGPPKAAIVDQASLSQANPSFVQKATSTLEQAGYVVDYYPGGQVTVDFYRELPTRGYDLLVLRTHSGLVREGDQENEAFLFTSEPYSQTEYVDDQQARRLIMATYDTTSGVSVELSELSRYFGIVAEFVKSAMKGRFDDTTIILMGCNGLTSNTLAKAFVERGAKQVASWDGLVSASHTDAAAERLLEHLLVEGLSLEEAVARTMAEVGPDPTYQSKLLSYPPGD
ncbi:MAG: hypothetical protein A2148_01220 [Chloroflexi bacterium RBG_16_68_14]|nr:MAG: hypothetical protein A2148_01220 [Chloroflexi bacterium RBG_16_68_14]